MVVIVGEVTEVLAPEFPHCSLRISSITPASFVSPRSVKPSKAFARVECYCAAVDPANVGVVVVFLQLVEDDVKTMAAAPIQPRTRLLRRGLQHVS